MTADADAKKTVAVAVEFAGEKSRILLSNRCTMISMFENQKP